MTLTLGHFLSLGAMLFALSVIGIFLNRKNLIVLLMAIELMLLAVNMNFVAFSHFLGDMHGQIFVFFILTVAAAESAIGLALLVIWVGALQLMLDKGKELDWFHSAQIVTLAVVAVVGFAFFLIWELTEKHPVVDLSLFKRRNFWSGAVATAVAYGLFFGNVVLLPRDWVGDQLKLF